MSRVIVFTDMHTETQLLSLFPLLFFISLIASELHSHTVHLDCRNWGKCNCKHVIHSAFIYTLLAVKERKTKEIIQLNFYTSDNVLYMCWFLAYSAKLLLV